MGCDRNMQPRTKRVTIFQSTHPSGVRPSELADSGLSTVFQSTHPSGVRRLLIDEDDYRKAISIHAPQWGATAAFAVVAVSSKFQSTHPSGVRPSLNTRHRSRRDFNPRTPVGCDAYFLQITDDGTFQSTHPSGVRPPSRRYGGACRNFNPRTPVGCDGLREQRH